MGRNSPHLLRRWHHLRVADLLQAVAALEDNSRKPKLRWSKTSDQAKPSLSRWWGTIEAVLNTRRFVFMPLGYHPCGSWGKKNSNRITQYEQPSIPSGKKTQSGNVQLLFTQLHPSDWARVASLPRSKVDHEPCVSPEKTTARAAGALLSLL